MMNDIFLKTRVLDTFWHYRKKFNVGGSDLKFSGSFIEQTEKGTKTRLVELGITESEFIILSFLKCCHICFPVKEDNDDCKAFKKFNTEKETSFCFIILLWPLNEIVFNKFHHRRMMVKFSDGFHSYFRIIDHESVENNWHRWSEFFKGCKSQVPVQYENSQIEKKIRIIHYQELVDQFNLKSNSPISKNYPGTSSHTNENSLLNNPSSSNMISKTQNNKIQGHKYSNEKLQDKTIRSELKLSHIDMAGKVFRKDLSKSEENACKFTDIKNEEHNKHDKNNMHNKGHKDKTPIWTKPFNDGCSIVDLIEEFAPTNPRENTDTRATFSTNPRKNTDTRATFPTNPRKNTGTRATLPRHPTVENINTSRFFWCFSECWNYIFNRGNKSEGE